MKSQFLSLYGLAALASLGVGAAARTAEPTVVLSARSFKHEACWTDEDALSGPGFSSPSMTVRWCARFCRGYEYFGLANGDGRGSTRLSLYKAKEGGTCHVRPSSTRAHSSESEIMTEPATSTSASELTSATIESAQTTESITESASATESESPTSTEEASESTSESAIESDTAPVTESETSSATLTQSQPETTFDVTTSTSESATETDAASTSESTVESSSESATELSTESEPEPTTTAELESTTTEDAAPATTSDSESSTTEEPETTVTSDAETTTTKEPETTTVTPDVETTTAEEPVATTTEEPETTSAAETTTTEESETTSASDVDTTTTEEASTTTTEDPETKTIEDTSTSTTETPTSTPTPCIDCQNLPTGNWLLASTSTGSGILELRYDSAGGYYYVYNECPASHGGYCTVYIAQVISVEAGITYDFAIQYLMSNVRNQANFLQISISTLPSRTRIFTEYFSSGSTNGWTDFRTSPFTPTVSGDVLITVNWLNDPNNALVLIRNIVMQPTECRNPLSELTCNTDVEVQVV
ncbi:hypothetical protein SAPIO_CDS6971 [Scedosporium apiospermum]|uniref:CBM-cenC domain-containing protein n=1 Tax=Pseudallescheria apiosperma TaxID=563466 RepID=A0A084G2U1_PSEDA|nr:uncharacterized protein SAPIO_CDS6971 [Scedosporium apiospermum]KEZ41653.1 hypothetical protein SAPIO_CDS6971 [Scedosporium apiospermum]